MMKATLVVLAATFGAPALACDGSSGPYMTRVCDTPELRTSFDAVLAAHDAALAKLGSDDAERVTRAFRRWQAGMNGWNTLAVDLAVLLDSQGEIDRFAQVLAAAPQHIAEMKAFFAAHNASSTGDSVNFDFIGRDVWARSAGILTGTIRMTSGDRICVQDLSWSSGMLGDKFAVLDRSGSEIYVVAACDASASLGDCVWSEDPAAVTEVQLLPEVTANDSFEAMGSFELWPMADTEFFAQCLSGADFVPKP